MDPRKKALKQNKKPLNRGGAGRVDAKPSTRPSITKKTGNTRKKGAPSEIIEHFDRYVQWLRRHQPRFAGRLRPPASDTSIQRLEKALGKSLPPEVVALWKRHDGQKGDEEGVLAGFVFLSAKEALAEWRMWAKLRADHTDEDLEDLGSLATSRPRNAIQRAYTCEGWLPLWKEPLEGNYLGVDLSPGPEGAFGQVINFGRDEDEKAVLAPSLASVISWLATEAEANRVVLVKDEDDESDEGFLNHSQGRVLGVLRRAAGRRPSRRKP